MQPKPPNEVSIVIETVNAAFFDCEDPAFTIEISRILHDLANQVENGAIINPGDNLQLYDTNGNLVGHATAH